MRGVRSIGDYRGNPPRSSVFSGFFRFWLCCRLWRFGRFGPAIRLHPLAARNRAFFRGHVLPAPVILQKPAPLLGAHLEKSPVILPQPFLSFRREVLPSLEVRLERGALLRGQALKGRIIIADKLPFLVSHLTKFLKPAANLRLLFRGKMLEGLVTSAQFLLLLRSEFAPLFGLLRGGLLRIPLGDSGPVQKYQSQGQPMAGRSMGWCFCAHRFSPGPCRAASL